MVLNGGTFSTGASTGYTETIGTLTLSSSSTISFGTGSHTLTYAASNGVSWSGTLSVNNWTSTGPKLYFGTSNMGLTATQLSNINFTGFGTGAKILSTGEIIPASVYISASSGNWNTGSTWVGSSVPSAGAIVFVENGHNVTLDVAASVTGLTIHSGGTFTASDATPRTLTITKSTTGNVTTISNSGTWQNGSGTSTVLVTGAPSGGDAVHSISGTITFQNIVVNKTGGTSNIGCSFGSGSSVAGTLEIGAGGFISTAPPASFYGSNAILKFNQGTGATYNVEAGDYSWSTTQVPNYITISSGTVNLNANRTASGNLLIDGGALILNLNTPNLTIQGNWTRTSGNFTAGSGTVTLSGTTNGVVDVAGGATMNNLVINKTSGTGVNLSCDAIVTGTLTITSGFLSIGVHDLTITGPLTNSAGSGGLVVESGGSLITNGTVSGGATVKREIASDSKWHFISSPVSGQNICDGNFAPLAANFNATTGATFDFYKWSEPTITGGLNWINLKQADWSVNTTAFGATLQFAVGAGYLVDYTGSFGGSTTKSFAGTLISGDQSVTLTTGGNTWNLIGNPFASAINWDNVIKTGILADGYYYVYNEAKSGGAGYESYLNSTYKTSGANGKISAMQGFFVKAASSPLSLPNAARTHDNNWMKKSETSTVNQLTLKMGNDAAWDEAFLVFEAAGSLNKGWYDAEKMFSMSAEVPQVYTLKDNDLKISIGSFPVITGTVTVPVGMVIPSDGSYSFQLSGFESFASLPGIVLEDLKLHTTQNLVQTPAYNFTAATADDPNRFLLHFAGTNGINDALAGGSFHVFASGNTLFVTDNGGQNQGTVYVYNLMGQMISTSAMNGKSVCSMSLDVPAGYYLVKVITAGQNYSTKVFINK
ncbi:MAG: T9SS type A sorting domain-containing protein [Bacteroidetes bacterium]|nr:T9SS type A sorting domain-containing protein [Bacteroidota bacterium]